MAEKNFGLTTDVADENHNESTSVEHFQQHPTGQPTTVFDRYINFVAIVNFGFCLQAGWESAGVLLSIAILNGGPATYLYGVIISGVGSVAVAFSLGEMASIDPTVGAQYRWSARFARHSPEFWGLLQGWITVFAWITNCASGLIGLANIVQGLIAFWSPSYQKQSWHAALLMWAFVFAALFCNFFLRRILNTLETIGGVCHVLFFVVIVAILTSLGQRSSPEFVFNTLTHDLSGWTNPGIAFHLGLTATLVPLTSCDGVLHMIDETKEPRKRVPKSMVMSTIMNTFMLFGYVLAVLFCIGDYKAVSQAQLPILEVYHQATRSKAAATIMLLMSTVIIAVSVFNIVASVSRLTWAFAKDKGLPFHEFFSQIHPTLKIPIRSLSLVAVVCCILALINIGSEVAFNALVSLPVVAINLTYLIPIFHLTMRKLRGEHPKYGPFKLGRWGIPVNIFSMMFCIYCLVWTPWPPMYPVSSTTFNYAGPITLVVIILALIDWFTTGKTRFKVPAGAIDMEMDDLSDSNVPVKN